MEEALKILKQMDSLLKQINYLGRRIDGIDDEVRNRAYTDAETMEEESIEEEREKFKVRFNECQKKLPVALRTPENASQLIKMLQRKKSESEGSKDNINLLITWVKMAEERMEKKDIADREK